VRNVVIASTVFLTAVAVIVAATTTDVTVALSSTATGPGLDQELSMDAEMVTHILEVRLWVLADARDPVLEDNINLLTDERVLVFVVKDVIQSFADRVSGQFIHPGVVLGHPTVQGGITGQPQEGLTLFWGESSWSWE